jgi:hypothetical protein
MYSKKEKAGLFLLLLVIVINLTVAFRFYNLETMPLNDFFLSQGQGRALFNPNIRY